MSAVFPPASGLAVDEPNPIVLRLPPEPGRFFRALPRLVSRDAVLYWEGRTERTLAAWLNRLTTDPHPPMSFGVQPRPDFYHVPLTTGTLEELATRVERAGAVRRRVRLHIHEAGRTILEWRPAFGTAPLLLSRHLGPERVEAFLEAAGAVALGDSTAT
jgi:hypothetical protein